MGLSPIELLANYYKLTTKYTVLRDDLKLTADTLQKMCFILCHNMVRTRGVIFIPTPVRYADLCSYESTFQLTKYIIL